ncbi:MAG: HAD-IIB family hydrolase [Desulfurivibrio sp.]|nr:HAD-IIB family hydrolase [Desulfurivibrio sp.]
MADLGLRGKRIVKEMPILLCSDLDRTILPNGPWPESPAARPLLRRLAARPELRLAYVSGRDLGLLQAAIAEYAIPRPDYAIGDVGTTIYRLTGTDWQPLAAWQREIGRDWRGRKSHELAPLLADLAELRLQEPAKQKTYKLSYYTPARFQSASAVNEAGSEPTAGEAAGDWQPDPAALLAAVEHRLQPANIRARLVWSIDEDRDCGLLDILPARAGKLAAIHFLLAHLQLPPAAAVFAGDSGNDLDALGSELNAILVANAPSEVRRQARELVAAAGRPQTLYCATGNFRDLNGNYSAGVIEGLVHYHPQIANWL